MTRVKAFPLHPAAQKRTGMPPKQSAGSADSIATHGPLSAPLKAVLQELLSKLEVYVLNAEPYSIDIRSLPLMTEDYTNLQAVLGKGEISATINTLGHTDIFETGIPGIWWICHYNTLHQKLAEFIEITDIPEILKTQRHDLEGAVELLNTEIASIL